VDITRPLSSVRQICLQGNRVLFGAHGGGYLQHRDWTGNPLWCGGPRVRARA
jgi:hypothetical protein